MADRALPALAKESVTMRKTTWPLALASLLLAAALAAGGGAPALAAPPAQSVNLLLNGGFEESTTAGTGTSWLPWWQETARPSDGSFNYAYRPSWNVEKKSSGAAADLVLDGNASQRVINSWDPWWAGVKQVVTAPAGARVRLTVSARLWAANANWPTLSDPAAAGRIQVGLEPSGSDNQFASSVVWSSAIAPHNGWQTVSVEAVVGSGGRVTAILSADYRGYSRQFLGAFFDQATLTVVSGGTALPTATRTPAPTATPPTTTSTPVPGTTATATVPATVTAAPSGTASAGATGLPATYLVKAGDTLGSIARRFNLSLSVLMAANKITNADRIYVGQVLIVRGGPGQPPVGAIVYVVQRGDTLNRLARRYNTTVAQLKLWNNLKTDVIFVGQRLIVGP